MLRRLVFTLPLIACAVLAQTPPPPIPLPVAPPVKPELATPVPDHSQEAYVVERYKNAYRFENDGTGRHEVSARIKVQSEAGVEAWGQLVVGYNSANERVEKTVEPLQRLALDGRAVGRLAPFQVRLDRDLDAGWLFDLHHGGQ